MRSPITYHAGKPMLHAIVFVTLLVAGFTCGIVGSNTHSHSLAGFGGFLLGAAIALHAYGMIHEGVSSSNLGRFRRDQEPFRFWYSVLFVALFAIVFMLGGLLVMLGRGRGF